jgi:hypothetical protein
MTRRSPRVTISIYSIDNIEKKHSPAAEDELRRVSWEREADLETKWQPRYRLLFILGASIALWALIALPVLWWLS